MVPLILDYKVFYILALSEMINKVVRNYYKWHLPDYIHSIKVSARDNYAFIRFKKIKFLYLNTQITLGLNNKYLMSIIA